MNNAIGSESQMSQTNRAWESLIQDGHRGGDATNFSFSLASLTFGNSAPILLPAVGVTAIVGGNNVGKSTALKQIYERLGWDGAVRQPNPRVLTEISLNRAESPRDLFAWLGLNSKFVTDNGQPRFSRPIAGDLSITDIPVFWSNAGADRVWALASHLVSYANARDRFSWTAPVPRRPDIGLPASHPLHTMEERGDLIKELNDLTYAIFRKELTLDRLSGSLLFRVGRPSSPPPLITEISNDYVQELTELAPLSEQGDGMQSVLGVLIPLITSTHQIVLIDEPEAFLHPPQARALGQALAKIALQRKVQIVIATHDRNMIVGLAEVADAQTNIVRLTREQDEVFATQLSTQRITKLWQDPVLKYSSVLDGLFHQVVVLAENEQDCHFYSAAIEEFCEKYEVDMQPQDILFVSTNGKTNIPKIASTLRDVGVRVIATPDLDALNDRNIIERIVTSVGGTWATMSSVYEISTAEFRMTRVPRLNSDVQATVDAVLSENPSGSYDKSTRDRVNAAMHVESEWKRLKTYGVAAFRAEIKASESLMKNLADSGVVLVEVGVLENFAPEYAKGQAWLESALNSGKHKSQAAQNHARRLLISSGARIQPSP